MQVKFESKSGQTHTIGLAQPDYSLPDLMTFREFNTGFGMFLAKSGGPPLEASWWLTMFMRLQFQMQIEKDVLPFKYEFRNDIADTHGVFLEQAQWDLAIGNGECGLTQSVACHNTISSSPPRSGSRIVKWIDCRGQSAIETDHGPIKIARRKANYRLYDELPGLIGFLSKLPSDELVCGCPA